MNIVHMFEVVFSFDVKDNKICPCLHIIKLSYNIKKCFSACLHKTVNMVVFLLKVMKIPTQKGEHSCKFTELSPKGK